MSLLNIDETFCTKLLSVIFFLQIYINSAAFAIILINLIKSNLCFVTLNVWLLLVTLNLLVFQFERLKLKCRDECGKKYIFKHKKVKLRYFIYLDDLDQTWAKNETYVRVMAPDHSINPHLHGVAP